ncbi:MAG TPA: hypothetical protein VFB79_01090 [Candidatus Angelobacter sp.]|nr:hypothetical protein [Candidatus Angelobacter sp.]
MQRNPSILFATLLFIALAAVSANAQAIPAEDDTWVTGSGTQVDFASFGNINLGQMLGSTPVNTVVSFSGVPLNSSIGQADTLVSRGSTTVASNFSAPLSIKGLSLASSPDLKLQDGRVYHITVGLGTQSATGQISFTQTTTEGGTYSSSFTVTPVFTLTNVSNPADTHTINCASDPNFTCSFPMNGSGNWVLTSSTGFDPQSMGIPTVPAGVVIGGYTTVGKKRSGGIQVGCGGTKAGGYGCGQNDELHGQGSAGQAIHGTKPPNDCAQNPLPPPPQPSPTPVSGGGGGCAVTIIGGGGGGCTVSKPAALLPQQPISICAATAQ